MFKNSWQIEREVEIWGMKVYIMLVSYIFLFLTFQISLEFLSATVKRLCWLVSWDAARGN